MRKRVPFTSGDPTDHQHGTDDILTSQLRHNILIGDAGGGVSDHSKVATIPSSVRQLRWAQQHQYGDLSTLRAATTLSRQ